MYSQKTHLCHIITYWFHFGSLLQFPPKVCKPFLIISNYKVCKMFSCSECPKLFNTYPTMFYHNAKVHEGIIYRCNKWHYHSSTEPSLNRHVLAKHEGISHLCDQCNQRFNYKPDLKIHKRFKHDGKFYECNKCSLGLVN